MIAFHRWRFAVAMVALGILVASTAACGSADEPSSRMPDGREWTTRNLAVSVDGSYCYDGNESNCDRYGRLYTWEAAQRGCRELGDGWRLPTNPEWQSMAKHYGGVFGDSADDGEGAYAALVTGGKSGFNAVFGGNRDPNGQYARVDAHGLYWTSSESDSGALWFYNFGGQRFLNRHRAGNPMMAISVRCIR
jgi:uncharacterized protein (TIGR02145 family)